MANVIFDLTNLVQEYNGDISLTDLLQRKFGKNIFKELDDLQFDLDQYSSELNMYEDDLLSLALFDSNGIMDQLGDILHSNNEDERINMVQQLTSGMNDSTKNLIMNYIATYDKVFDLSINSITKLDKIGEAIRGDKQLFNIGLSSDKVFREAFLDIDQMHKFMSQKNLFNLVRTENGSYSFALQTGLNRTKVALGIAQAQGVNLTQFNNKTGDLNINKLLGYYTNDDPLTQKIWKTLYQRTIYSTDSLKEYRKTGDIDKLSKVFASRKFEIMRSGIFDQVYQTGDTSIIDEIIDKNFGYIDSKTQQYIGNGYKLDNISGFARGDTMLQQLQDDGTYARLSLQQKYFGNSGAKYGFKISNNKTISQALSFWKDESHLSEIEKSTIKQDQADNWIDNNQDEMFGYILNYNTIESNQDMYYDSNAGTYSFWEDANIELNA